MTIPIINTASALACLLALVKTEWHGLQYAVLFIQAVSTILTGYETLGIFLYSSLIILLFCNRFFVKNRYLKAAVLGGIWLITILGLIPFGWPRVILAYTTVFFFCTFYYFIYKKMERMLVQLLPPSKVRTSVSLPEPGTQIDLKDFGLSERQIQFVGDYIKCGISYNDLSEKYMVSLSTVKSEMAKAMRQFGVKSKEDMRILLLQYKL